MSATNPVIGTNLPTPGSPINWRGEWNVNNAYSVNDAINFLGSMYIAIQVPIVGDPGRPDQSPAWQLMVRGNIPGFSWEGDWDASKSYLQNQAVLYQNNSYIALKDVPKTLNPKDNKPYWSQLTQQIVDNTWMITSGIAAAGVGATVIGIIVNAVIQRMKLQGTIASAVVEALGLPNSTISQAVDGAINRNDVVNGAKAAADGATRTAEAATRTAEAATSAAGDAKTVAERAEGGMVRLKSNTREAVEQFVNTQKFFKREINKLISNIKEINS